MGLFHFLSSVLAPVYCELEREADRENKDTIEKDP